MLTDAASKRVTKTDSFSYPARLLVTVALLAVYLAAHKVALPFVQMEIPWSAIREARVSILALGITPLLAGFFLVELFSLTTPPGRRLRQSGGAGRARLNQAALVTSLSVAALQATWTARGLDRLSSTAVTAHGVLFTLVTIAALTAATAAVFALGRILSTYGIGNGFALITLAGIGWNVARGVALCLPDLKGSLLPLAPLLVGLGLSVLVFRFIRSAEDRWIPAFPQSVLPGPGSGWLLSYFLPLYPVLFSSLVRQGSNGREMQVLPIFGLNLLLIALLSWPSFHLFSSRPRLEASLSEPAELLDDLAEALRRRAFLATGLLLFGTALLRLESLFWDNEILRSFGFSGIVYAVAIGLDLLDQLRFQRRHDKTALLVRLDNVHLSYRLEERLQEEGIAALARGHQFRSLYFFFGALYKIDMLVPAEQLDRARTVLAELETAREVRVF